MDPSFQYYRAKRLKGDLNTLHNSLGYSYRQLSYRHPTYSINTNVLFVEGLSYLIMKSCV